MMKIWNGHPGNFYNKLSIYVLIVIFLLFIFTPGCASSTGGTQIKAGDSGKGIKVEGVFPPILTGGKIKYLIVRLDENATFNASKLGLADRDIPMSFSKFENRYELIRKGEKVSVVGTLPALVSDGKPSEIIIPKRHIERFMASGQEKASFKFSDP